MLADRGRREKGARVALGGRAFALASGRARGRAFYSEARRFAAACYLQSRYPRISDRLLGVLCNHDISVPAGTTFDFLARVPYEKRCLGASLFRRNVALGAFILSGVFAVAGALIGIVKLAPDPDGAVDPLAIFVVLGPGAWLLVAAAAGIASTVRSSEKLALAVVIATTVAAIVIAALFLSAGWLFLPAVVLAWAAILSMPRAAGR